MSPIKTMTQTLAAKDIDIRYLIDNFGLQLAEDEDFCREFQEDLPEITELEKQLLDLLKDCIMFCRYSNA